MNQEMLSEMLNKYSRLTDSLVESIIFDVTNESLRAQIVIYSRFEKFRISMTFENISDFHIPNITKFMIWETEVKQLNNRLKIEFKPVASDWGEMWFLCETCNMTELPI